MTLGKEATMHHDYSGFVPPPRFQPREKPARQEDHKLPPDVIEQAIEILKLRCRHSIRVDRLRLLFGVRLRKSRKKPKP